MTTIFHLCFRSDWEKAQQQGVHAPPSLKSEGFVHASSHSQFFATAQRYFAGQEELLLLELDSSHFEEALRWEAPAPVTAATAGLLFPHIYAEIPVEAVIAVHEMRWDGEDFVWPEGVRREEL